MISIGSRHTLQIGQKHAVGSFRQANIETLGTAKTNESSCNEKIEIKAKGTPSGFINLACITNRFAISKQKMLDAVREAAGDSKREKTARECLESIEENKTEDVPIVLFELAMRILSLPPKQAIRFSFELGGVVAKSPAIIVMSRPYGASRTLVFAGLFPRSVKTLPSGVERIDANTKKPRTGPFRHGNFT